MRFRLLRRGTGSHWVSPLPREIAWPVGVQPKSKPKLLEIGPQLDPRPSKYARNGMNKGPIR